MLVITFYSDGVLNPNGVRFGSAEIYNVGKYWTLMEWGLAVLKFIMLVSIEP